MKIDRISDQVSSVHEYGNSEIDDRTFLKRTLLLATTIFLITSPAPDSHDIAEMTANFIVAAIHSHPSTLTVD